jgi:TonB family protein
LYTDMPRPLLGAACALALFSLTACTTPRPPLPNDKTFQPPPEAHFNERPDALPFDQRYTHDPARFTPPVFLDELPGTNTVSPRGSLGLSDAYVYFVIEKDGRVRQVKLIIKTGQPDYDEAIERRVLRWRFKPATMDGQPVAVAAGRIFRLSVHAGL